jgi:DNA-binding NarL/FixJ family response regulator
MPSTKVLIVEDEPAIAQDISFILDSEGYDVVGIAHSVNKALDMLAIKKPEIALLDIALKGSDNGVDLAHIINKKYKIPFVFLTSFSDKITLEKVKETCPYGYIVKPYKDKDLAPALEVALMRHSTFTKVEFPNLEKLNADSGILFTGQEYTILKEMWRGKRNLEIAEATFLSINTIKTHIANIYLKLDVHNRSAALAKIRQLI